MKKILKVVLFPIIVTLSVLVILLKGILYVGGGIMGLGALLFCVSGIISTIQGNFENMGKSAFIIAYLFCPLGLPLIAVFIVAHVELFRDWLWEI